MQERGKDGLVRHGAVGGGAQEEHTYIHAYRETEEEKERERLCVLFVWLPLPLPLLPSSTSRNCSRSTPTHIHFTFPPPHTLLTRTRPQSSEPNSAIALWPLFLTHLAIPFRSSFSSALFLLLSLPAATRQTPTTQPIRSCHTAKKSFALPLPTPSLLLFTRRRHGQRFISG